MIRIAAIALSLVIAPVSAGAAPPIVSYTFTGTVTAEADTGGSFAPNLVGEPYKETFYVDYNLGEVDPFTSGPLRYGIGADGPLFVDGTLISLGNDAFLGSNDNADNQLGELYTSFAAPQLNPADFLSLSSEYRFQINTDGFDPSNYFYTIFFYKQGPTITNEITYVDPGGAYYDYLFLSPTLPIVAPLALAVPEPAMWVTMMLGLGAIGGVMRKRRSIKADHRRSAMSMPGKINNRVIVFD